MDYTYDYKMRGTQMTDTTNDKYGEFVERISNALIGLDTIRVELCSLSKEINEYQSSFDKNDQTYLHKLEYIDTDNAEETAQMIREWKQSRNGRRDVKDLSAIVANTIEAIPYKNYANALPILKGSAYIRR